MCSLEIFVPGERIFRGVQIFRDRPLRLRPRALSKLATRVQPVDHAPPSYNLYLTNAAINPLFVTLTFLLCFKTARSFHSAMTLFSIEQLVQFLVVCVVMVSE
jgi:hypothetical protein